METHANFPKNQGAGLYRSFQAGAREHQLIEVQFLGNDPELDKDDFPPFTYWEDTTPICDYHPEI